VVSKYAWIPSKENHVFAFDRRMSNPKNETFHYGQGFEVGYVK